MSSTLGVFIFISVDKDMLSNNALQAFKKIYLEEFGEEIDDTEATAMAVNLLTLFDYIYRPLKKEWFTEEEIKTNRQFKN